MRWIILVFLAQFFWALSNYIDHYLLVRYRITESTGNSATGTLLLVSSSFEIVIAFIFFIASFPAGIDLFAMPLEAMYMAISVGVIEILWLVPYLYALDVSDEATAAPLFQTVPIFGLILGFLVFNEPIKLIHVVAIVIILIGSITLNFNPGNNNKKLNEWKVIKLMLVASFLIAFSAFVFKSAVLDTSYIATAFWMSVGGLICGIFIFLIIPLYRKQFIIFLRQKDLFGIGVNATNEIMDNLGILAFYGAVAVAPSTVLVQSMVAYQPVFLLLIGILASKLGSKFHSDLFIGRELVKRVIGISIIVFGSILIFL